MNLLQSTRGNFSTQLSDHHSSPRHSIPVHLNREWSGLLKPLEGRQVKLTSGLPRIRPKTFWYVSAGNDWRPLVFLSDAYRENRLKEHSIPRPDLFVYSCLGDDGLHSLNAGKVVFEDKRSEIKILSLHPLLIDRGKVTYLINPDFVRGASDPLLYSKYDAALMQIEVRSLTLGTSDRFPVLYLAMENLNCFDEVMSKGFFDVQTLCATREGLAFGGCGKSILRHVYTEGRNITADFHPRFVITWSDYTDELFRTSGSRHYPEMRRVADYIPERLGAHDHQLYELYPENLMGSGIQRACGDLED